MKLLILHFINECVEVYKIIMNDKIKKSKQVVFDLDETLGSFIELNLLNNIIEQIGKTTAIYRLMNY